jgi:hypothetical protein
MKKPAAYAVSPHFVEFSLTKILSYNLVPLDSFSKRKLYTSSVVPVLRCFVV